MKKFLMVLMLLVFFTLLNGCSNEGEYSIDSKFLYSDNGRSGSYEEGVQEFNVGNDLYLKIEITHSLSINQNEEVEIEISFPISDTFNVVQIEGPKLETYYDEENNLIVYKCVLLFNEISTVNYFIFGIITYQVGEIKTNINFPQPIPEVYDVSHTISIIDQ